MMNDHIIFISLFLFYIDWTLMVTIFTQKWLSMQAQIEKLSIWRFNRQGCLKLDISTAKYPKDILTVYVYC